MRISSALACCLFITATAFPAHASIVDTNGMFTVRGTNFPENFGPTDVSLDGGTYSLANNRLNVNAQVLPRPGSTEWLLFNFSTTNGEAIAGNLNALWRFNISDIDYAKPALWKSFTYWWSIDGVAVTNIQNWAGGVLFPDDGTNPIDPGLGMSFGGTNDDPFPPFDPALFISPFNLISTSSTNPLDPADINGFHVAALVVEDRSGAVPEPATIGVWAAIGSLGCIAGLIRRRRQRMGSDNAA